MEPAARKIMDDHLPMDAGPTGLDALLSREIDPLFWPPQRLGLASAWWAHVPFAFWITVACRPRVLVELGTDKGISYAAFCEAVLRARLGTRCFAVDTWTGDEHSGHYGEETYNDLREFHDRRYGAFSNLLRFTFDDAVHYFEDGAIDLLHIDGYHTYEAVKHDYETWRPKLSDRAIVLFHDTNVREDDFGVCQFFAEISKQFPSFEFPHGYGLGIVAVGDAASSAVKRLCAVARDQDFATLTQRFSHIGDRWGERWSTQWVMEARLAAANEQLTETGARAETLRGETATLNEMLSRARQEAAAERDAAVETMRGETAALNEALSRARQEAAERDAELVSLRADLAHHVREVQELRDAVAGSRAEASAQRDAFIRARQEAETMRAELTSLGEALASTAIFRSLNRYTSPAPKVRRRHYRLMLWLRFALSKKSPIMLADRARDAGEWAVAAHYYEMAIERNPNRPEIWVQYGHVLKEAGRLSSAEQAYRQAIAGAPPRAEPYRYLGDVLGAQQKRDDAVTAYLQAHSLDPTSPHALSGLRMLGWSEKELAALQYWLGKIADHPSRPPLSSMEIA
jgi:tetratricopeptide (TPR) repeat protein